MQIYQRKMKTACNKNLDVYDFKEELEVPDFAIRIKSKLENPTSAIDKYNFLETAAAGKNISVEEINYVPSLDIGAMNINYMATTLLQDSSPGMIVDSNEDFTAAEIQPQFSPELRTGLSESEVNVATISALTSNDALKSVFVNLSPSTQKHDERVGMKPDENGRMCERSSLSSDAEDDGAGPSSDHCIGGWEMDSEDTARVDLYPDYVVYCDSYYTDSMISFSSSFIEMKGSTADGDEETFKFRWEIDDILQIRSHWYEQVEMAMVVIFVLAEDGINTEIVECTSGTELKFAVIGSCWYERLESITSLNLKYTALWSYKLEPHDTVLQHTGIAFSKYLPKFDERCKEVVYPKGDADAVSLSKRDFDLLQPNTFVNDTIIDFYIMYLKNKIKPEERHIFHFFNSFFFRKLADPDKDPLDASKGLAAYQRVRKWTRKVNLFEKDYLFIPVNYNYHWSLIVMCHLGEVATYEDKDINESIKVPCVLHMDSLRGSHTGLKGLLQSYLCEEWKGRQQGTFEDISSRFDNLRFLSLELPQQQNSFDCGLFLLHYVELFLEQAPLNFNPFKITKSFDFLNVDWFPPAEASLKRLVIQRLICDLLDRESTSAVGNEEQHISCQTANVNKICSLTQIEEDAGSGGQFLYSQMESGIQQENEMKPHISSQEPFESSPGAVSISGREDSIEEIVNEKSHLDSEVSSLKKAEDETRSTEYVSMFDDEDDDDDDGDKSFLDMQATRPTGLESDMQHPTKRLRIKMTQP